MQGRTRSMIGKRTRRAAAGVSFHLRSRGPIDVDPQKGISQIQDGRPRRGEKVLGSSFSSSRILTLTYSPSSLHPYPSRSQHKMAAVAVLGESSTTAQQQAAAEYMIKPEKTGPVLNTSQWPLLLKNYVSIQLTQGSPEWSVLTSTSLVPLFRRTNCSSALRTSHPSHTAARL